MSAPAHSASEQLPQNEDIFSCSRQQHRERKAGRRFDEGHHFKTGSETKNIRSYL
ncbi:hypothetical protein NBRC3293_1872 [Gluconobacter oxydans NBRC 3293]|uniref:Uncharacterized protein n=1 Tax=Gluconobacter oxydans NBRC 3293 TaxID=1315969 RepID=A0A829WQE4_GLUOY|nr:hypothetical protein NBRC3293_1872 [Gluconobacter oxydans NBRC 3293]